MTTTELEVWSRKIVSIALEGRKVEDSRIELKAKWIPADAAAKRLAGHANAARGENIMWIFGVDENNKKLASVDPDELGDWYRSVEKRFDGFAPRLVLDVRFEMSDSALVSLYFDTRHEPPFVVKGETGGYPEYTVPWRVGTATRAANRSQLLSILVPQLAMSELKSETEYNKAVAAGSFGGVFRTDHFCRALAGGVFDSISSDVRDQILTAYAKIDFCNQKTIGYHQFSGNWNAREFLGQETLRVFHETRDAINALSVVLTSESANENTVLDG
ncbi:MAG: hypothetical protein IPM25_07865 [Chloracidobacterium sp.]|nr:hypothetical protein [Chloracidobacterium sp.]